MREISIVETVLTAAELTKQGFTLQKPTVDGWYEVAWDGDEPMEVYLSINPDNSIVWGWDETDDPELLDDDNALYKPLHR